MYKTRSARKVRENQNSSAIDRPGFRALLAGAVPALDLRIGTVLSGDAAHAVRTALQEAADLITRMPATFMTYPNGGPVLPTIRRRAPVARNAMMIDTTFLAGFGTMEVPRSLWQALERFSTWVEPALTAEWGRLMRGYAAGQNRILNEGALAAAMTWSEPSRGVALPRERAVQLIGTGVSLRCVWSGRRLETATLDIDYCLPWSAWPCSDLWNLLPAHRSVNQREKRDRLPSDGRLRVASSAIQDWWQQAYLIKPDGVLSSRFGTEARASLPDLTEPTTVISSAEVFGALRVQRLRLRHDQLVPEWTPSGTGAVA